MFLVVLENIRKMFSAELDGNLKFELEYSHKRVSCRSTTFSSVNPS